MVDERLAVTTVNDSDPTPRYGNPQPDPPLVLGGRRRRTAPSNGVPVYVPEQPSRRSRHDSVEPIGTLEERVTVIERGERGRRRWLAGAVISALGALGAVLVWALNAREAAGVEKERIRYLEREVELLRAVVYRVPRPDPVPSPAALTPAPKGPP